MRLTFPFLVVLFVSLLAPGAVAQPAAENRRVVLTFDDLPATGFGVDPCDAPAFYALNQRILAHLAQAEAPALGLANEGHVCEEARAEVLPRIYQMWLAAGHELGNHSFSHYDLNSVSLDTYVADIRRGEYYLRPALEAQGQSLQYFRHPRLHSGPTAAKRDGLAAWLDAAGYTVAPVTIDNQEWIFAAVYAHAKAKGDTAEMQRVATAYVAFMDAVFAYFEARSVAVLGYEPPQVLLLHANALNADHLGTLLATLRARGYTFIPFHEALRDPAYALPDGYLGPRGLSWIHRWALGKGMSLGEEEPREPAWLRQRFEAIY